MSAVSSPEVSRQAHKSECEGRRRVLLVSTAPLMGGGETYLIKLAEMLSRRHRLRAVVIEAKLATALRDLDIELELNPTDTASFQTRRLKAVAATWNACRRWKPDLVHLNGQVESNLGLIVALLGIPVVSVRHAPFNNTLVPKIKQPLVVFAAKKADATVCVSELLRRQLADAGVPQHKLHNIPNWVAPGLVRERSRRSDSEVFRLLFVGRLVPLKGAMDVLLAVRHLKNVHLDIVGEGPQRAELEAAAVDQPVCFHGFHKDCNAFYDRADLVIFPSYSQLEGQGQVPLEAMARGTPCLVSDIEVALETTDNGRCAALFRCGDPEDLARQVRALQADPERLEQLRLAGLERVKQVYTEDAVRDRYFELYESVIQEHASRRNRKRS